MHTKYLIINNRRQRQKVKNLCTIAPNVDRAIFSEALIIESINLSDLSTFVVSSNKCYSVLVANFECQKQKECLNRMEPSIDKVSHEYIVGLWTIASYLEKLHQIVELTVNISTYLISNKIA